MSSSVLISTLNHCSHFIAWWLSKRKKIRSPNAQLPLLSYVSSVPQFIQIKFVNKLTTSRFWPQNKSISDVKHRSMPFYRCSRYLWIKLSMFESTNEWFCLMSIFSLFLVFQKQNCKMILKWKHLQYYMCRKKWEIEQM